MVEPERLRRRKAGTHQEPPSLSRHPSPADHLPDPPTRSELLEMREAGLLGARLGREKEPGRCPGRRSVVSLAVEWPSAGLGIARSESPRRSCCSALSSWPRSYSVRQSVERRHGCTRMGTRVDTSTCCPPSRCKGLPADSTLGMTCSIDPIARAGRTKKRTHRRACWSSSLGSSPPPREPRATFRFRRFKCCRSLHPSGGICRSSRPWVDPFSAARAGRRRHARALGSQRSCAPATRF